MNPKALAITCAIAHVEGYFNGKSISWRNHNPGNLRAWGTAPVVNGYAQFTDAPTGFLALYNDVLANSGKVTLTQFLNKYAPAADSNQPSAYIAAVTEFAGVGADEMF